jgi:hypothetical protein
MLTSRARRFEPFRTIGHGRDVVTVIVGMLVALLIAAVVVALVAVPARREGRDLLSPQGEQLVATARERTAEVVGSAVEAAREKVGDLTDRLPTSRGADDRPQQQDAEPAVDLREPGRHAAATHAHDAPLSQKTG